MARHRCNARSVRSDRRTLQALPGALSAVNPGYITNSRWSKMTDPNYWSLAVFVLANLAAASSGAIFKPGAWYERIRKPDWRPPNWIFAPVWSVLYVMIAVSGWLVWDRAPAEALLIPMIAYGVQLLLNASWSGLFFGLRNPGLALVGLVFLWLAIAVTMILFFPISSLATWLLAPYLLWVSFAGVLNAVVWRMNRGIKVPAQ